MLKSSNSRGFSPCFPCLSTLQSSEIQTHKVSSSKSQHWSWRKNVGFSCCQTSVIPNVTPLSLAETYSMWEITNPSRWRSAQRPPTEQYPKHCGALYHTTSSVIYWACRKGVLSKGEMNTKIFTHNFCQLPSRVNPPTHCAKWILETCDLSVPYSIIPIIYWEYSFSLHCWIKASTHPQSWNLLDWDGYPCWPLPPKPQKYHKHQASCQVQPFSCKS